MQIDEMKIKQEEEGVTPTPSDEVTESQSQELDSEDNNQHGDVRMFTQQELNEIVGKTRQEAREKALRNFYERYGVNTDDELDDIFGRGQAYSVLSDNYTQQGNALAQLKAENALLKSGILEDRWNDVRFILGGKGLEINSENIASELATHPEWKATPAPARPETPEEPQEPQQPQVDPSLIKKFGTDVPKSNEEVSDDDIISKYFGVQRRTQ